MNYKGQSRFMPIGWGMARVLAVAYTCPPIFYGTVIHPDEEGFTQPLSIGLDTRDYPEPCEQVLELNQYYLRWKF